MMGPQDIQMVHKGVNMQNEKVDWHLDRRVTLGLVAAVLINVCTSVWWAASLNSQVINQQKAIDTQGQQVNAIISSQAGVGERLAKMEAALTYQVKALDRIEEKLGKK